MQETQVGSLIHKDPTFRGAPEPMGHNSQASALKTRSWITEAHTQALEPVLRTERSQLSEKLTKSKEEEPPLPTTTEKPAQQRRPSTAKNKF